jgi:putative membrane protein
LAFAVTSSPAKAQAPSTEDFVQKAATSDMFEIQSGQLAATQAENDDVKSFGQKMVDDHTKTSEELKQLVEGGKVQTQLPTELDQEHKADLDQRQQVKGSEFDRTYTNSQVKAHENVDSDSLM